MAVFGWVALTMSVGVGQQPSQVNKGVDRPNILWISSEDNGPQLGCYGDTYATTPNLDALAARGMRYERAWSCAPVCAPARTTIITGIWPNSLGAMHMRSQVSLPREIRLLPQYLQDLGYYCSNNVKEDYNVEAAGKPWNESSNKAHWRKRNPGQPFFSVFNFTVSHESQIRKRPHTAVHDPKSVRVPPYHPDLPEVRQDWAQYYDKITEMDEQVGKVLSELAEDGLQEETIVFYFGDHGSGMPRSKRWLYESGLRVPVLVAAPKKWEGLLGASYKTGSASKDLICFADLAPTVIGLAGGKVPDTMQGQAFLGPNKKAPREYIFGFRDRMDERYDCSRAIRDAKYSYIRNWMPHRAQGQFLSYMFETPTTNAWKSAFDQGKTNEAQGYFWGPKAPEELYDLEKDPDQIHNLASLPEYAQTLDRMRKGLRDWMLEIRDLGLLPESEMFLRAQKDPPYTLGHDSSRFALEAIEASADLATRKLGANGDELNALLGHTDSAVRYWGATGYLVRYVLGKSQPDLAGLRSRLSVEKSSSVRVVILETLARFGTPEDRETSLAELWKLADAESNDLLVATAALNALDHAVVSAKEREAKVPKLTDKSKGYPQRYNTLLPKLLEKLGM